MAAALVGALVTAAVSTLGDYLWANVIPHRVALTVCCTAWCCSSPWVCVWACRAETGGGRDRRAPSRV
jgi:hypothetical protein